MLPWHITGSWRRRRVRNPDQGDTQTEITGQAINLLLSEKAVGEVQLEAMRTECSVLKQKVQQNNSLISDMQLTIRQLKAKTEEERQGREETKRQLVSMEEFMIKAMNRTSLESSKETADLGQNRVLNDLYKDIRDGTRQTEENPPAKDGFQGPKASKDVFSNSFFGNGNSSELSAHNSVVGDVLTNLKHILVEFTSKMARETK